eukprot:687862-Heterocapsa_arctica.AAC.1
MPFASGVAASSFASFKATCESLALLLARAASRCARGCFQHLLPAESKMAGNFARRSTRRCSFVYLCTEVIADHLPCLRAASRGPP